MHGKLLDEAAIPIREEVKGLAKFSAWILYVANEANYWQSSPRVDVDLALEALQTNPLGEDATVIGEVVSEHPGFVMMKTRVGGTRVVDMLSGEQLPRIC